MQITELAARLEPLGLDEKQAKVYVAALFLGSASVQKIAEQAEVNRATTYVILDTLAEIGLVSQTSEGKKTVYVAESPEAIARIFDLQERALQTQKKELATLMPDLRKTQRAGEEASDAPIVRFYRGREGTASIIAESQRKARVGSTVYALTNIDKALELFPNIAQDSPKARTKKKISSKLIYSYSKGSLSTDKKLLRETKKSQEPIKADITLYDNKALLMSYGKNETSGPVGVVIEHHEIVEALRELFEAAWKNSK